MTHQQVGVEVTTDTNYFIAPESKSFRKDMGTPLKAREKYFGRESA